MYLVALVCTECRLVCAYDYIVSMFTSFICLSSNPSHSMVQGAKHIMTADGDKACVGFCIIFCRDGLFSESLLYYILYFVLDRHWQNHSGSPCGHVVQVSGLDHELGRDQLLGIRICDWLRQPEQWQDAGDL